MHRNWERSICLLVPSALWLLLAASCADAQLYDHLHCYKLREASTFASAFATLHALPPQFGSADCEIKPRARAVCVPVEKDLTEIVGANPLPIDGQILSDVRLCYRVRCPRAALPSQQITDQFGTRFLKPLSSQLVCTPAVLGTPPSSVTTSITTTTPTTLPSGPTRDPYLWPFDSQSPWNHPLGSGAVFASDADTMTIDLHNGRTALNTTSYTHPVYLLQPSDPLATVSLSSFSVQYPIPPSAVPDPGTDHHMHVVTNDRLFAHELWKAVYVAPNQWQAQAYGKTNLVGSGIAAHSGINIGTRAYGGSAIGGLIRTWEIEDAGLIRHTLAVSLMASQLTPGYVWPASAEDPPSQYSGSIPMGSLLAIKPTTNLATLGLSTSGRIVARALQDYGAYAVDTGSNGPAFYAEPTLNLQQASQIRADLPRILPFLYPVLNNSATNIGGGGVLRAPLAPPTALNLPPNTSRTVVLGSSDDAEQCVASGGMRLANNTLDFGNAVTTFCSGARLVGIRFRDLEIPSSATITSARVQLTADSTATGTATLTIRGQASSDASAFGVTAGQISSRPTTSDSVAWSVAAWSAPRAVGNDQRTPELRAIVQEIVNLPGWQPGNAMVLVFSGTGRRVAEAFDGFSGSAPLLDVTWQ